MKGKEPRFIRLMDLTSAHQLAKNTKLQESVGDKENNRVKEKRSARKEYVDPAFKRANISTGKHILTHLVPQLNTR